MEDLDNILNDILGTDNNPTTSIPTSAQETTASTSQSDASNSEPIEETTSPLYSEDELLEIISDNNIVTSTPYRDKCTKIC